MTLLYHYCGFGFVTYRQETS